jgi:hypothetical protein
MTSAFAAGAAALGVVHREVIGYLSRSVENLRHRMS